MVTVRGASSARRPIDSTWSDATRTASGWLRATNEIVPLFNPRQDRWVDQFAWNGPVLVGKTPVGTVTIAVLAINLPYRIALRAALIEEGIFPPEDE